MSLYSVGVAQTRGLDCRCLTRALCLSNCVLLVIAFFTLSNPIKQLKMFFDTCSHTYYNTSAAIILPVTHLLRDQISLSLSLRQ